MSPYEIYAKLRDINPAPFASFIDFGGGHIVSSSLNDLLELKIDTLKLDLLKEHVQEEILLKKIIKIKMNCCQVKRTRQNY